MGSGFFFKMNYKTSDVMVFLTNIFALILGIIYLISRSGSMYWNIYGIYMLVVLICNIIYAFFDLKYDFKGYLYLTLSALFMLLIPIFNLFVSFLPTHQTSRSIISCVAILSLFSFSGFIAALNMFKKKNDVELLLLQISEKHKTVSKKRKRIWLALLIFLNLSLLLGILVTCKLFMINRLWKTEVFISTFSLFYAFVFLSTGALIIKLLNRNKKIFNKLIYLLITFSVFVGCLIPAISVPTLLKEADISYSNAFGEEYKNMLDYENLYFRQVKFSIPEYFFGTVSKNYTVRSDIPFYNGTENNDKDLRLYFDVYSSGNDADMLPGGNSVLIRIHGGEWKYGDKGFLNNAQMNKYFASQGYVVFDVQYGLSTNNNNRPGIVDKQPYGDFTVDDMVRHLGIFLQYLDDNHEEFNANIDSVFISGNSAGGNLALALGMTYESDKYPELSHSRIRINGIIPFYPANSLAQSMGLVESDAFLNPGLNVDEFSPPCLIYQGTHDGIVKSEITEQLREQYIKNGNNECAIIYMPFGGHSGDVYFSGYYNQVFIYYMERFMFQYR